MPEAELASGEKKERATVCCSLLFCKIVKRQKKIREEKESSVLKVRSCNSSEIVYKYSIFLIFKCAAYCIHSPNLFHYCITESLNVSALCFLYLQKKSHSNLPHFVYEFL